MILAPWLDAGTAQRATDALIRLTQQSTNYAQLEATTVGLVALAPLVDAGPPAGRRRPGLP